MKTIVKILFLFFVGIGVCNTAFADRGVGKKSKGKLSLNVNMSNGFKPNLYLNLKSGLSYKGSLLANSPYSNSQNGYYNSFVTYQKGNTTYVIPYKQKVIVPETRQGYAGMKLIIKAH